MRRRHKKDRESAGFLEDLERCLVAFERGDLPLAFLKERYAPEYQSLRKAIEREGKGGPVVDDSIRRPPDFLRLVVLEIGPRLPGTTLDRINNESRRYEPGKLRWATAQQQALNRSTTKRYTFTDPRTGREVTTTVPEFVKSDLCPRGLEAPTIRKRLSRGEPPESAFLTPKGHRMGEARAAAVVKAHTNVSTRTLAAYLEARLHHFPTMPPRLTGRETSHMRRFAAEWRKLGGDPARDVRSMLAVWKRVAHRAETSSGKRMSEGHTWHKPWPWILSANVPVLWDALAEVRQTDMEPDRGMDVAGGYRTANGTLLVVHENDL